MFNKSVWLVLVSLFLGGVVFAAPSGSMDDGRNISDAGISYEIKVLAVGMSEIKNAVAEIKSDIKMTGGRLDGLDMLLKLLLAALGGLYLLLFNMQGRLSKIEGVLSKEEQEIKNGFSMQGKIAVLEEKVNKLIAALKQMPQFTSML